MCKICGHPLSGHDLRTGHAAFAANARADIVACDRCPQRACIWILAPLLELARWS